MHSCNSCFAFINTLQYIHDTLIRCLMCCVYNNAKPDSDSDLEKRTLVFSPPKGCSLPATPCNFSVMQKNVTDSLAFLWICVSQRGRENVYEMEKREEKREVKMKTTRKWDNERNWVRKEQMKSGEVWRAEATSPLVIILLECLHCLPTISRLCDHLNKTTGKRLV